MKPLDFLIIGAQKCATTTLFELLRQHPDIRMPLEKEVPFFTAPVVDAQGWREFARAQFGTSEGKLWGKATPQYMCDPEAASRIATLMPSVKLIAILRDPAQRTWSHYQMDRRRNTEQREFSEVLDGLLDSATLERSRSLPVPDHGEGYEPESEFYVAWSEYGRILQRYRAHFPAEQLLVIYTEDLQSAPRETLDRVLSFIGLPQGFEPRGLGEVVHRGGSRSRIPHGVRVWLRRQRMVAALWERMPDPLRGRWRFLYERWNVRAGPAQGEADALAANLERLRAHYARDLALLDELPLPAPPWRQSYGAG
ncbi:sulfotransferase [Halioglobus maricola]|uniref:Sulfotransferase n=1 Tax=Halioglobus maricola TaxID=2601894 RepID=A0A5P9NND6_9GAMM|nr:sulfotransferase [Halioglobus maricola]QFU77169.1 sulfotransferase [Halioglobus maricola]